MDVKKELKYVVKDDYELTADAVKSFYELKQFKLLLEKFSLDFSEENSRDINHIMKKILREEHQEEKILENLKNIFQKARVGFLFIINNVDKIIPDSNEALRLSTELRQISIELSKIENIMEKNGTFEELISEAEENFNQIRPTLEELNLIMSENNSLIEDLEEIDLELENLDTNY